MEIKIFSHTNIERAENEINDWLVTNPSIKIHTMSQQVLDLDEKACRRTITTFLISRTELLTE